MFPQVVNKNMASSALQYGYLNINGMRLDFNDQSPVVQNQGNLAITDGMARDCTNTNDILVSTVDGVTAINLMKQGLNGVDGTITPGVTLQPAMQVYVYAIASSENLQPLPPASSPGLTGQPPLNISIYQTNPSLAYEQALLVSNPGALYPNVPVQYPSGFIVSLNNPMGEALANGGTVYNPTLNAPLLPFGYDMYRYIGTAIISPEWTFVLGATPFIADFAATSNGVREVSRLKVPPTYNLVNAGAPVNTIPMTAIDTFYPFTLCSSVDAGATTYVAVPLTAQKAYLRLYASSLLGGGTIDAQSFARFSVISGGEDTGGVIVTDDFGTVVTIYNPTAAGANDTLQSDVFEVLLEPSAIVATPAGTPRPDYVLSIAIALVASPGITGTLRLGVEVVGWSDNI